MCPLKHAKMVAIAHIEANLGGRSDALKQWLLDMPILPLLELSTAVTNKCVELTEMTCKKN